MKQPTLTKATTVRFTPAQYHVFRQFALDYGYSGVADLLRVATEKLISASERSE